MIKVNGLDHININVKSIKAAKDFYEKFFGFKVHEDYEYVNSEGNKTRFMLIGDSGKLMLCLYEDNSSNSDFENSPMSHIGIHVENYDMALKIAEDNDLIDDRWGIKDYENSQSFYIEDPNGVQIEISRVFAGGH